MPEQQICNCQLNGSLSSQLFPAKSLVSEFSQHKIAAFLYELIGILTVQNHGYSYDSKRSKSEPLVALGTWMSLVLRLKVNLQKVKSKCRLLKEC